MPTTEILKSSAHSASPVIGRLAKDARFRRHVGAALQSARHAYDELSTEKRRPLSIAGRIAADAEIQDDLRQTMQSLSQARERALKISRPTHTVRRVLLASGLTLGLLYAAGRLRGLAQAHDEGLSPRFPDGVTLP